QTINAGRNPILPREGSDAGWRSNAPRACACRRCRDGRGSIGSQRPGQCSDQFRAQSVSRGRELCENAGGRAWGSTSGVDIDVDGTSVWVAERCGAFAPPALMKPGAPFACDGSTLPPIL